ncbi:tRNA pseudouridine(55) synthase TruB [Desulfovibrio sp. OttesenSCG-928-C06]|nr:tRNA pseudouridine(55) synthase TruB [Desulfovibrio sp. OttesenSCG-928-C06]
MVLNKPKGPTSAACIGMIKRRLGQKKIGHAGTLDPMATGVLLVLLGQATKISGYLMDAGEKIYGGTVKFGISTDTWDAEGQIVSESAPALIDAVTHTALEEAVTGWLGKSEQTVPPYSAAKHQGKPLYELARKGLDTPVKTKTVEISRAELEWFRSPLARFRVTCGSGTYIRSLAHSLGTRLGCGATLMELTREYSHPFGLDVAVDLDDLLNNPELLPQKVQRISAALPGMPTLTVDASNAQRVKNGNALPTSALPHVDGEQALLIDPDGKELALADKKAVKGELVWSIGRGLWN